MTRSKYGNVKTTVDGETFDSKGEAKRWLELRLLERAKAISDLQRQPSYKLEWAGKYICTYVADFTYVDTSTGKTVVEDFKGVRTPEYRIKAKMFAAQYGVTILETGSAIKPRRGTAKRIAARAA
jgi:hypothetical protein